MDFDAFQVFCFGKVVLLPVELTEIETIILRFHRRKLTRGQIAGRLKMQQHTIANHITRLRDKGYL